MIKLNNKNIQKNTHCDVHTIYENKVTNFFLQ